MFKKKFQYKKNDIDTFFFFFIKFYSTTYVSEHTVTNAIEPIFLEREYGLSSAVTFHLVTTRHAKVE